MMIHVLHEHFAPADLGNLDQLCRSSVEGTYNLHACWKVLLALTYPDHAGAMTARNENDARNTYRHLHRREAFFKARKISDGGVPLSREDYRFVIRYGNGFGNGGATARITDRSTTLILPTTRFSAHNIHHNVENIVDEN